MFFCCHCRGRESEHKRSAVEVKSVLEIIASTGKFWYFFLVSEFYLHVYKIDLLQVESGCGFFGLFSVACIA